jgi:decaprenyl-phosphate phosphoribosyltransferase
MQMIGILGMRIRMYLLCMRPLQWVKNLLVFAAPFAAGSFSDIGALTPLLYLFAMFCAAASTNYVLNDWLDRDYDSQHSQKKYRPIASGKIGYRPLLLILIFLVALQMLLSFLIPLKALLWVVVYFLISIGYSLYFKKIAVIEMFLVAIGFMVRAFAGAAAFKVEATSWFLIVIGFGALFLVANKRLAELSYQNSTLTRVVIDKYSDSFLKVVIGSSMTVCLVGYTLWAFQYSNATSFSKFSVVVFAVALMRYLWITDQKNAEKPEVVLFTDGVLVGLGLIFAVLISSAIYA